jgi:hypothetical protein
MSQPQVHHDLSNNPAADSSHFSNESILVSVYTFGGILGWLKAVAATGVVSLSLPTSKKPTSKNIVNK